MTCVFSQIGLDGDVMLLGSALSWRWGLFFLCVLRVGAILHLLCILYYNILLSCYIDSGTFFFFTNENLATWLKGPHEKKFIYLLVGSCNGQHESLSIGWMGLQPWCALLESMSLPPHYVCTTISSPLWYCFIPHFHDDLKSLNKHTQKGKKKKEKREQQLFLVKLFVQEIKK